MRQALFEIVDNPILVEEVTNKVARREAGAITTFIGTVRELTKGKRTLHLEYEAYKPMNVVIAPASLLATLFVTSSTKIG
ncbi:molybdenum cofactor biosynthesis protein MoaE, partial [Bacillus sp. HC-Mk]